MKRNVLHLIRRADFSDSETIFRLIRKHPRELLARSISDIVENVDRFFVCEVRGKVVGAISWQILPEIGAPRDATIEIKSLAVDPAYRDRGIGHALVQKALRQIRRFHPAKTIVLTFHPEFFAAFGFRKVPKESIMHKLYAGCLNCSKYDSPFTCPEIAMALHRPA